MSVESIRALVIKTQQENIVQKQLTIEAQEQIIISLKKEIDLWKEVIELNAPDLWQRYLNAKERRENK